MEEKMEEKICRVCGHKLSDHTRTKELSPRMWREKKTGRESMSWPKLPWWELMTKWERVGPTLSIDACKKCGCNHFVP